MVGFVPAVFSLELLGSLSFSFSLTLLLAFSSFDSFWMISLQACNSYSTNRPVSPDSEILRKGREVHTSGVSLTISIYRLSKFVLKNQVFP